MRLNTLVRIGEDVATVCYNGLDGVGAVWGEHTFEMPPGGFGDELPPPDVMLKEVEWEFTEFPEDKLPPGFCGRCREHTTFEQDELDGWLSVCCFAQTVEMGE